MTPPQNQADDNQPGKWVLTTPNGARAEICYQGAHVTHWQTADGETGLFLSERAEFAPGRAIRGGVPIIFPQFNAFGPGPKHGFARTSVWRLREHQQASECVFELSDDDKTLVDWPHAFLAQYRVSLTDTSLYLELQITNTGDLPCTFTAALHSYLAVQDAYQLELSDFTGVAYWDNDGSPFEQRTTQKQALLAPEPPIDRVYFDCPQNLTLRDQGRLFNLEHRGFSDCVVWNPGPEEAAKLADLGDDQYQKMLCVEAAAIDRPVTLAPGQTWQGSQKLTLTAAKAD